jgi:ADP-ribose pyrophosphatase YjhB (NUDIX family)
LNGGAYQTTDSFFSKDALLNFCAQCGAKVRLQVVAGDDRLRFVCDGCHTIHYENPKMVVGTIPVMDKTILLCRRAIEPCRGKWTLPAGWLENGETVSGCALRETQEEACAEVDDLQPYVLANLPFINQVYFFLRARLVNTTFHAGAESLEVKLFSPEAIPWDELAFSAVHDTLRFFCDDVKKSAFPFRILDIKPQHHQSNDIG